MGEPQKGASHQERVRENKACGIGLLLTYPTFELQIKASVEISPRSTCHLLRGFGLTVDGTKMHPLYWLARLAALSILNMKIVERCKGLLRPFGHSNSTSASKQTDKLNKVAKHGKATKSGPKPGPGRLTRCEGPGRWSNQTKDLYSMQIANVSVFHNKLRVSVYLNIIIIICIELLKLLIFHIFLKTDICQNKKCQSPPALTNFPIRNIN